MNVILITFCCYTVLIQFRFFNYCFNSLRLSLQVQDSNFKSPCCAACHKIAGDRGHEVSFTSYYSYTGCEITKIFWVSIRKATQKNSLSEIFSGFPNWKRESILPRAWFLQAFQSEILVKKLAFRQCFWVSRKAGKPVISHPELQFTCIIGVAGTLDHLCRLKGRSSAAFSSPRTLCKWHNSWVMFTLVFSPASNTSNGKSPYYRPHIFVSFGPKNEGQFSMNWS